MNDIIKADLDREITIKLLEGKSPETVSRELSCDVSRVYGVFRSSEYVKLCGEYLEKGLKSAALQSLHNITTIANDKKASQATRLKANQYIIDKTLEISDAQGHGNTPATMTQDQLASRLRELQREVNKRVKPIDTGVIDHAPDIDNMLS